MSELNIFKRQHVMLDIETLSTRANAAIVSIGAVKFTFEDGLGDSMLVNITPKSCVAAGLHVSKSTIEWWAKQPKEVREAWATDPVPLDTALESVIQFVGVDKKQLVWSQGASFDFPIIHSACTATNVDWKTPYWNECCSRTVFTLLGVRNDKNRNGATDAHTALGDAIAQAKLLIGCFSEK